MLNMQKFLYEQCFVFAVILCLLVWAVWLKTVISYGQNTVNKLTLKPFDMAIWLLSVKAIN